MPFMHSTTVFPAIESCDSCCISPRRLCEGIEITTISAPSSTCLRSSQNRTASEKVTSPLVRVCRSLENCSLVGLP